MFHPRPLIILAIACCPLLARGDTNIFGQSGLVSLPDARISETPVLRLGVNAGNSHVRSWATLTPAPWFELTLRQADLDTGAAAVDPAFAHDRYRAADIKLRLLEETKFLPQVAIGRQDLFNNSRFSNNYLVLSKRFGIVDVSAGIDDSNAKNLFGGLRVRPFEDIPVGLMVDYKKIKSTPATKNALDRIGYHDGVAYGIEFRHQWLVGQLSRDDQETRVGTYLQIPLEKTSTARKLQPLPADAVQSSPHSDQQAAAAPGLAGQSLQQIQQQLIEQGFTDISLSQEAHEITVSASHPYFEDISRSVGRIARTLNRYAPASAERFVIHYTENSIPVVSYRIQDRHSLDRYFAGLKSPHQLQAIVAVEYPASPVATAGDSAAAANVSSREQDWFHISWSDTSGRRLTLIPIDLDPYIYADDKPLQFEVYSLLTAQQPLTRGLYLDGGLRLTWWEDVSDAAGISNSPLPHVRSDIGQYKDNGRLQIDSLLLNQYFQPARNWTARASLGYYEEMFAGLGGQLLYRPEFQDWAVDVSADWLRQRDTHGGLGLGDYSVFSALLGLHYQLPGTRLAADLKLGRFLAKDAGARLEVSKTFASGIRLGAWYSVTNADDDTFPGNPDQPYHDRGILLSIPVSVFTGQETRLRKDIELRPWPRDAGQMVRSPDDLYTSTRQVLPAWRQRSGWLTNFGQ